MNVDEAINQVMRPLADLVSQFIFYAVPVGGAELPLIVAWLIAAGVFFTLYLGFINVRGFRHALDLVKGRYTDPSQPGEVIPFQALATALSGTVGIGNMGSVAVAISLGARHGGAAFGRTGPPGDGDDRATAAGRRGRGAGRCQPPGAVVRRRIRPCPRRLVRPDRQVRDDQHQARQDRWSDRGLWPSNRQRRRRGSTS
jgi:hypothetical protein